MKTNGKFFSFYVTVPQHARLHSLLDRLTAHYERQGLPISKGEVTKRLLFPALETAVEQLSKPVMEESRV